MATHSSILAWRIPWTEEPGGLQSMGSKRVGYKPFYIYKPIQNYSGKVLLDILVMVRGRMGS